MLHRIYDTLPVSNTELDELTREAVNTTAATLISTVIIGLIEGTFGALLFIIFGLPSPFLWGVVILILSMIPMIGTNLVLAPAGIILALSGSLFSGLLLVLLGLAGVSFTQNVLKPKLLGERAGLHPAVVLLATLGGIAWLGLIGFLIGPLLASLFIVVWRQFGKRYQHELSMKNRQHEAYYPDSASAAPEGNAGSQEEEKQDGPAAEESIDAGSGAREEARRRHEEDAEG
jgi:predicted PurR-regulated permease PerM